MQSGLKTFATLCLLFAGLVPSMRGAEPDDVIGLHFAQPPMEAKAKIWWFWGESVTTDAGITQDLEAMKRAGFGGVVLYEQVFSDPPDALKSLSPEWLARFRFAAAECARLGMTLEVNVSGGFVAGGPWITPALAMQRLVSSEMTVSGGKRVELSLPLPPVQLGFYRDVAVLAYPAPQGGEAPGQVKPTWSSQPALASFENLFASNKRVRISPPKDGSPVLLTADYGQPFTARSLSYTQRPNSKALIIATQVPTSWADDFYGQNMRLNPPIGHLEASDDGRSWRRLCELPAIGYQHDSWTQRTLSFPATTARFFRLNLHDWGRNTRANDDDLMLGGIALRAEARIDQWEPKAGNVADFSDPDKTPDYAPRDVIDPTQLVELTALLDAEGRLHWDAPPGEWTILRLGHTPTGAKIKHSRPELAGLECDKLSAAAVRVQFEHYVEVLLREVQRVPGAKLTGVGIDSNEHGAQNWTLRFPEEFKKRRGYELTRFLPAMVGRVVGNRDISDRFLYDVRRTIADLMSDEYFGAFKTLCHERGLSLTAQAPGIATCLTSDSIQAKGRTDIPMGEFWMTQTDGTLDCKEASSAAHVHGLPLAAAEAFTGSRAEVHPAMMKPFADAALALGINQFVVLAYVHQPWDERKPGVTEPRFYLPYQRHNTWWEESAGFWLTLARSSQLLRQGHSVNDLLYHLGGDTPLKIATWRLRPVPPTGYDYDVCNDEILLERTSVREGRIELPDGMSYRLLVLAGGPGLTLPAARKLRALVEAGAVVLASVKPTHSPSLGDGELADLELRQIVDALWGKAPLAGKGEKQSGLGRVLWGYSPAEALARLGLKPDFEAAPVNGPLEILYAHRKAKDRDFYFVANHGDQPRRITARFRVRGLTPKLWFPQTGEIAAPLEWQDTADGRIELPLLLEAHDSVFVVFDKTEAPQALPRERTKLIQDWPILKTLEGPWQLHFSPAWGGPEKTEFSALTPWNEASEAGIRHYSGAVLYRKSFELGPLEKDQKVLLDLGELCVLGAAKLNGKELGTAWKPPYVFEVSGALRPGRNELEVRVVNTWVNRLILDSTLPPTQRLSWTTDNPYRATDALTRSGLLGPVVLRKVD